MPFDLEYTLEQPIRDTCQSARIARFMSTDDISGGLERHGVRFDGERCPPRFHYVVASRVVTPNSDVAALQG